MQANAFFCMMNEEAGLIEKYFPDLGDKQKRQFIELGRIFTELNAGVNLVSRKDIGHLYERHILHSLAIARYVRFAAGSRVADVGTGGGFPGLPLAIYFPGVEFTLVDSIAKKINAVKQMAERLQLSNVRVLNERMEHVDERFDYAVSRAVAPVKTLRRWLKGKITGRYADSGLICLKGGNLEEEIREAGCEVKIKPVSDYFEEAFFREKYIVWIKGSEVNGERGS